MDQRQCQSNRDTGESGGRPPVRGTEDDKQKYVGQYKFRDYGGRERIPTRRMCPYPLAANPLPTTSKPAWPMAIK